VLVLRPSRRSSTVLVTETESTLTVQTVGPEATNLNLGLAKLGVGEQQPGTEDGLSKNVKNGVGNDLAVDTNVAGTVSKAPDTVNY
jgi:hypothetical protein